MRRVLFISAAMALSCAKNPGEVQQHRTLPSPSELEQKCEQVDVEAGVTQVSENVWMARGYDLANTFLIQTSEGNVIVDVASCPSRAEPQKEALLAAAPGPIKAIIYTHSHLDHIGGASVFAEEGTEIWATDAFFPHLMKQYGLFRETESRRAARQWGFHVSHGEMSCSSIGKRLDLVEAMEVGILKPTHTFSGQQTLTFGDTTIELVEAHGETHDQLFVWLPKSETLFSGDNYYSAFPNLYTVRGTSPRPVGKWIASLDKMRMRSPALLLPSHTEPLEGKETVQKVLTDYRDAIQWTRDHVVRGANAGKDLTELIRTAGLPAHLADKPYLKEMYGQTDWSVRAIYGNNLGWFDGRAEQLYVPVDVAAREVQMMGGPEAVLATAQKALEDGDPVWSAYLVGKVKDSALSEEESYRPLLAKSLKKAGSGLYNTNGRAYLLEAAHEAKNGWQPLPKPQLDDAFISMLPIETFFNTTVTRVIPAASIDIHESVQFHFTDLDSTITLTIRHGIAEYTVGKPLPGTPEPVAVATTDSMTWKKLAIGMESPAAAVLSGGLKVKKLGAFQTFMGRFQKER